MIRRLWQWWRVGRGHPLLFRVRRTWQLRFTPTPWEDRT